MSRLVLPGGAGHVGAALIRHFSAMGWDCVVLSRNTHPVSGARVVTWDGKTLGKWQTEFEGSSAVINLAGRSVNCCYNAENLKLMMDSRVDSTRVVGQAIASCQNPPEVWLQSSTATIYPHSTGTRHTENHPIGGDEPGLDPKWKASLDIARAWEAELDAAQTPKTRRIALRSAMTMSVDHGSVFDVLLFLTKKGLQGQLGSGRQFVSWIHERDFCRAVEFLIERRDLAGIFNLAAPEPLPQVEFARALREAAGVKIGLPAMKWMIEIGCLAMKTESELVLKSRCVVPQRLLDAGFKFDLPTWPEACRELIQRQSSRPQ